MYAGFWRRFAAVLIDGLIFGVVAFAIVFFLTIVGVLGGKPAGMAVALGLAYLLINVLYFFGQWLYFALLESSPSQATFGKRALGIKVVDARGERIGFGRATGRYFAKLLSSFTLLIGYLMAAFTEKKQALHDMVAGTYVVYREVGPEDFERGYFDGPPRSSGAVVAIVIVALLFVPMVIGILAAIAIPAYQEYTIRAQVSEGVMMANSLKEPVTEFESREKRWPDGRELGIAVPPGAKYVHDLRISHGTITVTYGATANNKLRGQTLSLQPALTQTGAVVWRCGRAPLDEQARFVGREGQVESEDSSREDTTSGTTLEDKYLPASCRG